MNLETMERANNLRGLADEIEECLNNDAAPMENPVAVKRIGRLCAEISSLDNTAGEKAGYLLSDVKILFSTHKHERHGGSDEVYRRIKMNLDVIRTRANNIERGW
jgi:hypothetical protein